VQGLLKERPGATSTSALTGIIIRNAVNLAQRCVTDTAAAAADKHARKKSKKSHGIVDKFLNQARISHGHCLTKNLS